MEDHNACLEVNVFALTPRVYFVVTALGGYAGNHDHVTGVHAIAVACDHAVCVFIFGTFVALTFLSLRHNKQRFNRGHCK